MLFCGLADIGNYTFHDIRWILIKITNLPTDHIVILT